MKNALSKRISTIIVVTMLLITAVINTSIAEQESAFAPDEIFHLAYDAQVVQNTLYILLDEQIISLEYNQEVPNMIINLSEYPEVNWYSVSLFSDEINLYMFDSLTGVIYQIDGLELKQIIKLDISEIKIELDSSQDVIFKCPVAQNGFLYILCTYPENHQNKLIRFSLDTGTCSQIQTNDAVLREIARYKNGQLLGLDYNTQKILAIDMQTGNTVDEIGILRGYSFGALAYDAEGDKVYSLSDAEIVQWENKEPKTVSYLAVGSANDAIYAGIWNGLYIFIDNTGMYTCNVELAATKVAPLTIWSEAQGILVSELISDFMRLYPQIPVVVRGTDDENPAEKIAMVNITKDTSIDIFAVSSQHIDGKDSYKHGYAEELDSILLKEDVLSMYPQIQEYLTQNNALYGFPAALWTKYWTVQPELLEGMHLGGIPERIEDYYDMMLLWYEDNGSSNSIVTFNGNKTIREEWQEAIYFLSSQYIHTYACDGKPISFNTPVFRTVLEKIAVLSKLRSETVKLSDYASIEKSVFQTNALEPFSKSSKNQQGQYIFPPTFTDAAQPVLDATLVYFIVNPYSKHKQAAIQFLEFFSQNMELALKYKLHPNYNTLVEKQDYQRNIQTFTDNIAAIKKRIETLKENKFLPSLKEKLTQAETRLADTEKNRWEYSEEIVAEYRKLAPYICIKHSALIWDIYDRLGIETILMKYLEGRVTLDQAVSELDGKVKIMFFEDQ